MVSAVQFITWKDVLTLPKMNFLTAGIVSQKCEIFLLVFVIKKDEEISQKWIIQMTAHVKKIRAFVGQKISFSDV